MINIHNKNKKKLELGFVSSIILITIFSFIISFIIFYISSINFDISVEEEFTLLILNTLPILFIMLLIYFIFNNAIFSFVLSLPLFLIMAIANAAKIEMRQDPLLPTDFFLISDFFSIINRYAIYLYMLTAIIAVMFILIFLSFFFFKGKKFPFPVRILCIICLIVSSFIINFYYYADIIYFEKFEVTGNKYFKINQYKSKGFLYCFVNDLNNLSIKKPANYNLSEFENENKSFKKDFHNGEKKPHIIMVMAEAFSDLSENQNIHFYNNFEPMKNFKEMSESKNAISGHIIVPNFGGGTSDTEFDVLTGAVTKYIHPLSSSYDFIRRPINAIPRELKNMNYSTLAIHPGYPLFYNRQNVYPYMGFENFISIEEFNPEEENKGLYISDDATVKKMLETFENHINKNNNPLFQFTVTIQNHGPFESKYTNETIFKSDIPLNDEQYNILSNYFIGVKDDDTLLGTLKDYFENSEEPVVIVFFGDHLPGFTNGMSNYTSLEYPINPQGTTEEIMNLYKTPFLIWENDSAKKICDFSAKKETIMSNENKIISANYLGTMTLELMGINNVSAFFEFSNKLRKDMPIVTNKAYMDKYGNYKWSLSGKEKEAAEKMMRWNYYNIFNNTPA